MPTTTLMPLPKQQYLTALGTPLLGGKLYTYAAGTSTPKETYTDAAGTAKQPNPIPLNLRGEPDNPVFWSGNYRVELRSFRGDLIYSVDNYNTDPAGIWGIVAQSAAQFAAAAGSSLIGFMQAGIGAVLRTVRDELRDSLKSEQFGAIGNGIADDGDALLKLIDELPTQGAGQLLPGKTYRTTKPLNLISKDLFCIGGKATIILDVGNQNVDGITMDAITIRNGTAQAYRPCAKMRNILVLVRTDIRHGVRVAGGDYGSLEDCDIQRDPDVAVAPKTKDGLHLEPSGNGKWIENFYTKNLRIHDFGRDGMRKEVPAGLSDAFINVCKHDNMEVRGCGLDEPGAPVHFVSNNTDPNEKISSHVFDGGEFQTNSTGVNPNPDGFKATRVAGGAPIENIKIDSATAECVPTNGAGFAVNTTGMSRVVVTNFLPFGFQGAGRGIGGTGTWVTFGYLGLDYFEPDLVWTPEIMGETTAGTPVYTFRGGHASRVGVQCLVFGSMSVSSLGGAAGTLLIKLPWPLRNRPFANFSGTMGRQNVFNLGVGYTAAFVRGRAGTSFLEIVKHGSTTNTGALQAADITQPFELEFSLPYNTD